jgi:uncharacterized protein YoxC
MVEVVTLEEFTEFRKSIEERLDAIEERINDLVKDVQEKHMLVKSEVEGINKRLDDIAESSRSFVDRLRTAIRPQVTEPSPREQDQI